MAKPVTPRSDVEGPVKNTPSPPLIATPETLIEEMACAIAEAQAALFAGRYSDMEVCAQRLQGLCTGLKKYNPESRDGAGTKPGERDFQAAASRLYRQNKIFAAVLTRVRRHLEAFRALLNGPSVTYQPTRIELPESKS
ncbi:MAG TPA: hypothetical protein VJO35_16250 [Terriglobales bacterium]|nr:hypothetical protein [Terriglobales bacterium]